jgi:hypothetical protein
MLVSSGVFAAHVTEQILPVFGLGVEPAIAQWFHDGYHEERRVVRIPFKFFASSALVLSCEFLVAGTSCCILYHFLEVLFEYVFGLTLLTLSLFSLTL